MKRLFLFVLFFLFCFSLFSADQTDERVMKVLNSLGFSYDIDSDNDFRLILDVGSGRTQLIFINSGTNTSRSQEIREVWSMAAKYPGSVPQAAAQTVLLDSYDKIIGSWYAIESSGNYILIFCAKIPADADSTYVNAAIQAVARGADSMENILTDGADEY